MLNKMSKIRRGGKSWSGSGKSPLATVLCGKKILISLFSYFLVPLFSNLVYAEKISFPKPGHEGLNINSLGILGDLEIGLWLQYRIMYNNSNIPGPGGTTYTTTKNYDFFRQRFRMGLDIKPVPSNGIGGYVQLEYRGGWGGSSPGVSDPRDSTPANNPFNRLQSRGVRYGFVYANFNDILFSETFNVSAGIIPLTDRVGRTLFDADWDFNVGGVVFSGKCNFIEDGDYRLGYVRLVEGVGASTSTIFAKDADLILADYNLPLGESTEIGLHIYNLTAPESLGTIISKSETWYGLTANGKINTIDLNGMVLLNKGKIGSESHTGTALKLEGGIPVGKTQISVQAITTTGDESGKVDNRFVTLHQLVGTEGFWGYTHIFTANGPSDVNDLGLEIGNNGAGLTTIQTKVDFPLIAQLDGQLFGGWFQADKERNNSKNMGTEFGGMLTYNIAKNLNWEIGAAFAPIGDFYAKDSDSLQEIFSRFQLTW